VKRATKALVDCSATGLFMDMQWAQDNNITTRSLTHPIHLQCGWITQRAGPITEVADIILHYTDHAERALFAVTKLGRQKVILSFSWLCQHNPEIDWQTREVCMWCEQCATWRLDAQRDRKAKRTAAAQIRACRSGDLLDLVEDEDDEDDEGKASFMDKGDRLFAATVFPSQEHLSQPKNF
jgi:hypothetical protein